ncbi:MAG: signal peptide peptidase SppA [Cyanobacteria bacterium P01_G01_bin.49]
MNFFKQTLASLVGTLAGLLLFATLGVGSLVLLLMTLATLDSGPTVKDKSVLVFDLSTQIQDREPPITWGEIFASDEQSILTLRQVVEAIEKATKDSRIQAIFLDGGEASDGSGYAVFAEVREALTKFKKSGKKIIAYDVTLSEQEYYLSSLADSLIVNPLGLIEMNGLGIEPLFWTGALDKYGIGVQVVRVGDYKSAVEPFIRTSLSTENREQLEGLLTTIWGDYLNSIEKSRKIAPNILQNVADTQGILDPKDGKKLGLIDQVGYRDQAIGQLKEITNNKNEALRQVSLGTYTKVAVPEVTKQSSDNQIAVVYAQGTIVDGEGTVQQIGANSFASLLRKVRENEAVKAVVIRINSPGGSATASEIILREVQLIQEKKPVIISMGNVAASGGYWIATGGQHIFAQPNTVTGSIGVFGLLFNLQEIANNNGITWDVVKTGELANLSTVTRPKTDQELAIYQKSVSQIYNLFLEKVAKSRNLSKAQVADLAQGKVWSGKEAKKIGLIDSFGGLESAISYAAEQTKLGEDWEVVEYPKSRGLTELFVKKTLDEETKAMIVSQDPIMQELLKVKDELTVIGSFNDPRGIYFRLPFNWQLH